MLIQTEHLTQRHEIKLKHLCTIEHNYIIVLTIHIEILKWCVRENIMLPTEICPLVSMNYTMSLKRHKKNPGLTL